MSKKEKCDHCHGRGTYYYYGDCGVEICGCEAGEKYRQQLQKEKDEKFVRKWAKDNGYVLTKVINPED